MRPSPGEDAAPPGFPEATESLTAGAGTTVSTEVTGLDSGTTHEYRAVASAGEVTDEGGVRSFDTDESGGGCFLTTATADDARTLDALRRFRDESMAATPLGRGLVGLYYRVSPPVAGTLARHPGSRTAAAVRWLVGRCGTLSEQQARAASRVRSILLGGLLAALYVVGLLTAVAGHAVIRTIERAGWDTAP